jgi:hypothetical protein
MALCAARVEKRDGSETVTRRADAVRMGNAVSPDVLVARVAEGQWGLIRREQARDAGLTAKQVQHRCTTGRWRRVAAGVYLIAGAPGSWKRDALAACLAGPTGTVASFLTAGALHASWRAPVLPSVTAPPGTSARMRIAKVHRAVLDRRDVMRVEGVPCTTPARTIIDVATVLAREPLSEIVDDMLSRRLASAPFVLEVADRSAVRAGMPLLREVLDAWSSTITPGSPAEVRALRLLEQWGFGRAVKQHEVRRSDGTLIGRLDLAFPEFRDGADYDTARWHNPRRWGHDEARYADLAAAGWHVAAIDKHDLMPGEHAWRDAFAAARARRLRAA